MPSINDLNANTQGQIRSTTQRGTNRVAKFDANSYFFLEDGSFTQLQAQSFGILSTSEFQTTAHISVNSVKKVVAVCSGQIFIQPQSGQGADPLRVNLILKPFKQPINGISIQYFIYRGLPKSDFFDSSGKVLNTGSGLITQIRTEFADFYNGVSPFPDFLASFLGFPDNQSTQQNQDILDQYFAKVSQTLTSETGPSTDPKLAFDLPIVAAGTHIATTLDGFGFDIILSEGDAILNNDPSPFKVDLKFARAANHILDTAVVSSGYLKKVFKEACARFIDPAAYYGLHANGGTVKLFGQAQALSTPQTISTLISNFNTRNNIYLYV